MNKMNGRAHYFLVLVLLLSGAGWWLPAMAQDIQRGAMLYVRLANNVASCASCHGPDPSQGRNNILFAADNPGKIIKSINNIGAMGYLSSELSEADTSDISAFLGRVAQTTLDTSPLRVWPWTLDFGSIQPGLESAKQFVRISNASASPLNISDISVNSADMALTHNCPTELVSEASCEVQLTLRPIVFGLHRASLLVTAGGKMSALGMVGYGAAMPVSRLVWTQPDTVSFAATQGNTARATLTLSNPGPMPAVLGLINVSGDQASQFKVESGCGIGTVLQAGTSCNLSVSYLAGVMPQSNALLQLRSDQTNPSAVRLQGSLTPTAPAQAVLVPPGGSSGGGCAFTSDPSRSRDITLMAALLAAAAALARQRRRKTPQH